MTTQRGKQSVMTGAIQPDFSTPASADAQFINYYTESFVPGEGLEEDDEIRSDVDNDRDTTEPAPSLANPNGSMDVALDMLGLAFWFRLLFGNPVTTGAAAPYTHVFKSGASVLPSATLEVPMGTGRWKGIIGAKANTFGFSFDKAAGYSRAQLGLVARQVMQIKAPAVSLFDGVVPDTLTRAKAAATSPTFAINGVTLGRCVGGNFQYTNNLEREDFADGSPYPSDYLPGKGAVELTPRLRLDQQAAANAVLDYFGGSEGAPFEASVTVSISAALSLTLTMAKCKGEKISPTIGGPGPVEFQGRIVPHQTAAGPMLTATLVNSLAAV